MYIYRRTLLATFNRWRNCGSERCLKLQGAVSLVKELESLISHIHPVTKCLYSQYCLHIHQRLKISFLSNVRCSWLFGFSVLFCRSLTSSVLLPDPAVSHSCWRTRCHIIAPLDSTREGVLEWRQGSAVTWWLFDLWLTPAVCYPEFQQLVINCEQAALLSWS